MAASWGQQLIGAGTVGGTATSALFDCPGGRMVIVAHASAWNGATAVLQELGPDGATLIDVSDTQAKFTADGNGVVDMAPCMIQMTVTGGPPAGLFVSIARVVQ